MLRSLRPLFGALLIVPLAACDPDFGTADLSQSGVATDNQNYAAQVFHAHRYISIARGSGNLSEPDRAGLASFVAEQASGRTSALHVELTGMVTAAEMMQLTRVLVADGIDPDKIDFNANKPVEGQAPAGRPGAMVIDVETERWKPILPTCPEHSRLSIINTNNPDSSNYGCSVLTNLEVMVSDPRDLVMGETGGHTDAGVTTAAIERLQGDKLKPLPTESTRSAN